MNHLEIEQRDKSALRQGYSPAVRRFEIASIVTFAVAMAWLALHIAPRAFANPWLALSAFMLGFVLADFVSGFVHWAADTWGTPEWPLVGRALIRPFREHHVDQKEITRHDFIETNGNNCFISIPVGVAAALIHQGSGSALFGAVFTFGMLFFVFLTNQFHKWAHTAKPPAIVTWLQRWSLVLPRDHHRIHHAAPSTKYYCITVGWMNEPLHRIRFYPVMEWLVSGITGLVPREDDIGKKAALQLLAESAAKSVEPDDDSLAKARPPI